jgi:hypothetical protein
MTWVKWQTIGFDAEKKPYLAILEGPDPKYTFRRKFISKTWQKTGVTVIEGSGSVIGEGFEREWTLTGASFDGELEPGTVLEARELVAGFRHPVVSYFLVNDGGMKPTSRATAKALAGVKSG